MMYINELSCLNLQGQIDATMSPEYAGEDGLPVQLVDDNAREQARFTMMMTYNFLRNYV
jgi:hypothetical protein